MKTLVLAAALLLSLCGSASALDRVDADAACRVGQFQFLVNYLAARENGATEAEFMEAVRTAKVPADFRAAIARFVRADFAGDKLAANKALEDAHRVCVNEALSPTTEM
jgi:hypothetical protein